MKETAIPLELLAPAKDLSCGIAAIDHGADAVYIGGPSFGARANAGNSVSKIEQLVSHAHTYQARVYTTLNTLLYDDEIVEAEKLIWQLYEAGVDAIIIQDLGLLECSLPPIQLHASTQLNNRTPEKARFLEQVGFSQVVLARELNLKQIKDIHKATSVPLEFFIQGALCVSYSGQCYISQLMTGRSANRGNCAQFCRHKYNLTDSAGTTIAKDSYLLSLKDLNLSSYLTELADAGIRSFKIEGRLKNEEYVKNVTAYYRQQFDALLESSSKYCTSSSGTCSFSFAPDPQKTFHRGSTSYYLNSIRNKPVQLATPKSLGKLLGPVTSSSPRGFTIKTDQEIHNGDGLCYLDNNTLVGLRVNRIEKGMLQTRELVHPPKGTQIHRNSDGHFLKLIKNSANCRKIDIAFTITGNFDQLTIHVLDEDGVASSTSLPGPFESAKNGDKAVQTITKQLQKTGGTQFTTTKIILDLKEIPFLPTSILNKLRRDCLEQHHKHRLDSYQRLEKIIEKNNIPWLNTVTSPLDNITNKKASHFYLRHGVTNVTKGPEAEQNDRDLDLMTTKYCIKYQLDLCPHATKSKKIQYVEPFFLQDNIGRYQLYFDCDLCQMRLRLAK